MKPSKKGKPKRRDEAPKEPKDAEAVSWEDWIWSDEQGQYYRHGYTKKGEYRYEWQGVSGASAQDTHSSTAQPDTAEDEDQAVDQLADDLGSTKLSEPDDNTIQDAADDGDNDDGAAEEDSADSTALQNPGGRYQYGYEPYVASKERSVASDDFGSSPRDEFNPSDLQSRRTEGSSKSSKAAGKSSRSKSGRTKETEKHKSSRSHEATGQSSAKGTKGKRPMRASSPDPDADDPPINPGIGMRNAEQEEQDSFQSESLVAEGDEPDLRGYGAAPKQRRQAKGVRFVDEPSPGDDATDTADLSNEQLIVLAQAQLSREELIRLAQDELESNLQKLPGNYEPIEDDDDDDEEGEAETRLPDARPGSILPEKLRSKYIRATEGEEEVLDKRYKVQHSARFQPGEVFKVLWSEPAGSTGAAPSVSERMEVRDRYGGRHYVGFRRFIVVANDEGHCTCVPILTYSRLACKKRGVKAQNHGVVYAFGQRAKMLENEPKLGFMPVRCQLTEPGESLAKESRVNYSKLVTVEHNVKVFFIGHVVQEDFNGIVHQAVNWCWANKKQKRDKSNRPSRGQR